MKSAYFISYFYGKGENGASGFGNLIIHINGNLDTMKKINKLSRVIEKDAQVEEVIILNYKRVDE